MQETTPMPMPIEASELDPVDEPAAGYEKPSEHRASEEEPAAETPAEGAEVAVGVKRSHPGPADVPPPGVV